MVSSVSIAPETILARCQCAAFDINPPAGNTERIRHAEALQAKWRTRKHLQTERVTAWAVALAHHLGLPLHPSKSRLTPSEEIDFLGMHLRSCQTDVVIQLTPPRRASLLSQLRQLRRRLRNARSVTPRAKAAWRRRPCSQCARSASSPRFRAAGGSCSGRRLVRDLEKRPRGSGAPSNCELSELKLSERRPSRPRR